MNKEQESAILQVRNLKKSYTNGKEGLLVFDRINFDIPSNTFISLTGSSGSGKSTLLHIIGGLDRADQGSIRSGEREITALCEEELSSYRNSFIGFVFQFHYLLKEFTAKENVMLPAYLSGRPKKRALGRAEELLAMVGLEERIDHYPNQLSGGEQQRVAVARSMINDPQLILADEPTGNLDEKNSEIVFELLESIVSSQNKSLLLVSHNRDLAARAETQLYLKSKQLYCEGAVS